MSEQDQEPDARLMEPIRSLSDPVSRYRAATAKLTSLQGNIQELNDIRAAAMAELHGGGMSYRDIARVTGVSPQRVAQLIGGTSPSLVAKVSRAWAVLESRLIELGSLAQVPISRRKGQALLDALWESNQVNDDEARILQTMLDLRNEAVHTGTAISEKDLTELVKAAEVFATWLDEKIQSLRAESSEVLASDREEGEAILSRVLSEFPDVNWTAGRCEECSRAMPIPLGSTDLWVCSRRCRESWFRKLRHFVSAYSEEEAMTRTPKVVPYWL